MLLRTKIQAFGSVAAATALALVGAVAWTTHVAGRQAAAHERSRERGRACRDLALAANDLLVALDGARPAGEIARAFDSLVLAVGRIEQDEQDPDIRGELAALRGVLAAARAQQGDLLGPRHTALAARLAVSVNDVVEGVTAEVDLHEKAVAVESAAAVRRGLAFAAIIAAAALVGLWAAKRSILPRLRRGLAALADGAHRLEAGDLGARIGLAGTDELATAGAAFDAMADRLRDSVVSRDHLEAVVSQRTADLERSRAELSARVKQLEDARMRLGISERLASVGRLARGLTHEVNNPLAVALANVAFASEELAREPGDPEAAPRAEVQRALAEAVDAGRRVSQIVRDLLAFSREPGDAGPSDITAAVSFALRLAGPEVRARALLELDLPREPLLVRGGAATLGQVVSRLLLAAAAAIPPGDPRKHLVRVAVRNEELGVVVDIRDSGEPIPAEMLPHVFDPFFTPTAGFTHGQAERGIGLGLAACYGLVRGMGGTLTADSVPGRDTCFRLRIPVGTSETRLALGRKGEAGARRRVLVVSADPMVCAGAYRVLSRRHDVVPHTSPVHALTLVRAGEAFDAVVCDAELEGGTAAFLASLSEISPVLTAGAILLVPSEPGPETARFLAEVANRRVTRGQEDEGLLDAIGGTGAEAGAAGARRVEGT